jgi:hypothetical protein
MSRDHDVNSTPTHDRGPEPANVVAAMASAVERVRFMAKTVFNGDADLFADSPENG